MVGPGVPAAVEEAAGLLASSSLEMAWTVLRRLDYRINPARERGKSDARRLDATSAGNSIRLSWMPVATTAAAQLHRAAVKRPSGQPVQSRNEALGVRLADLTIPAANQMRNGKRRPRSDWRRCWLNPRRKAPRW